MVWAFSFPSPLGDRLWDSTYYIRVTISLERSLLKEMGLFKLYQWWKKGWHSKLCNTKLEIKLVTVAKEDSGHWRSCGFQLFSAWKCWVPWFFLEWMIWNIGIVNGEVPWSILRLKMHIDDMRKCAPSSFHQTPGPNSIDGQFKHKKMSSSETWHFCWAKGGMGDSYYGVGNMMCWNVCLYSMHVFDMFLFLSSHVLHLFIHLLIFGWNPFFSAVSTMKDCKDSKFCTSPFQDFSSSRCLAPLPKATGAVAEMGAPMVHDVSCFFFSMGWIKIQWWWKQTQKLLEAEIVSHDIHL